VTRGDIVESVHRGHLVVIDGFGETILSLGDPDTVTFIRSAAKPFQLMPCITAGAADRFGFSDAEIALACASHSGEPIHVDAAAGMLRKIGLSEADLRCGHHFPFDERRTAEMMRAGDTPTQFHNNCSGKHSAMLAYAKHIGADLACYEDPSHPIQLEILKTVSIFTGVAEGDIHIAIDGCSAPNYALPLRAMARGFLNLVFPSTDLTEETREGCRRIVTAMMGHPELIGGTERLDTLVMKAAPGKIICKVGAEGVWLCGVLPSPQWPKGLGVALKIEDGDDKRCRPVVGIELMRRLGIIGPEDLAPYSPLDIKTRKGQVVGMVECIADLYVK
jgi:L-asparaginase II